MSDDARAELSDDAIRGMLETRAERLVTGLDPRTVAAEITAAPRSIPAGRVSTVSSWVGLAAAASAVIVMAAALMVGWSGHPVASSAPSAGSDGSPPGASEAGGSAVAVEPLPAEAFGILARRRAGELAGRLAVVRAELDLQVDLRCGIPGCGPTFRGSGGGFTLRIGDRMASQMAAGESLVGAFLVRFSGDRQRDQPVIDLMARLITDAPDGWTSTVATILAKDPGGVGDYAAVDGWLVRTPIIACPSFVPETPLGTNAPVYSTCEDDYLTDDAFQPLGPDGAVSGTSGAIVLPMGSYEAFAPDAQSIDLGGFAPRRAVYILRKGAPICPIQNGSCATSASYWGTIEGVLEALPGGAPSATPAASLPVASASTGTDAISTVWTVDEIETATATDPLALADGRLIAVRGWLVATPSLRCRSQPVPSGAPSWGCDEIDWITADPFQPWTSDGHTGSARPPVFGLRAQVGAYARFAGPVRQPAATVGEIVPALGTYLVRGAVRDGCATVELPVDPSSAPCIGPAVALWEVVGRVPDTHISPPIPRGSLAPGETPLPGTDGSGDTPCGPNPCGENGVVTPKP